MATRNPKTPADALQQETNPTGVVVRVDGDDDDETLSDDEVEAQSVVDRFQAALQSSEADTLNIKVYRINNTTGKTEYCQDMTRFQFDRPDVLDLVRNRWGAGEYEFRLIGSRGIVARRRQSIAEPLTPVQALQENPQVGGAFESVIRMMAEGQQKILEALQNRPDPMAQMTQMLTMAKLMKEAFGPSPNAAPAGDPMMMVTQVFEMVKSAKSAVKELADEDTAPPADPMMAMIPQALEAIKAIGGQRQQTPLQPIQMPAAPIQPITPPVEHQTVTVQSEPEPIKETPEQMLVRSSIETLCIMAEKNEDIEKGAEFIADTVPDEMLGYMKLHNWFDLVAQFFPIVTPHREWIEKAKARADELLKDA